MARQRRRRRRRRPGDGRGDDRQGHRRASFARCRHRDVRRRSRRRRVAGRRSVDPHRHRQRRGHRRAVHAPSWTHRRRCRHPPWSAVPAAPAPPTTPTPAAAPDDAPPADPRNHRMLATAAPAVRQRAKTPRHRLGSCQCQRPRRPHRSRRPRRAPARATARLPTTTRRRSHPATTRPTTCPSIGLRRNIAQRMEVAKTRIPHFTYVEEVDVTEVERLRAELNRQHRTTRPDAIDRAAVPDAGGRRRHPRLPADERALRRRQRCRSIGTGSCTSASPRRPQRA